MSLGKIIDTKNNNLSMKIDKQKVPEHVAIIMDGNGTVSYTHLRAHETS